jgi:hypothetical protein
MRAQRMLCLSGVFIASALAEACEAVRAVRDPKNLATLRGGGPARAIGAHGRLEVNP